MKSFGRRQIVLECFDSVRRPFGQRLDVRQACFFTLANYLMTRGGPLGKKPIAHP